MEDPLETPHEASHCALLILDVQNDFLLPNGSLPVLNGESIIPIIAGLRARFPPSQVYHTQDWHPPNHISFSSQHPDVPVLTTVKLPQWMQLVVPAHCVQDSFGAQFHEAFLPVPDGAHVVRKGTNAQIESHSAFYDILGGCTGLYPLLKNAGVTQLVICGVHTDVLVLKTVHDALKLFPEQGAVAVVSDAITGFVPERCTAAIREMAAAGAEFVVSLVTPYKANPNALMGQDKELRDRYYAQHWWSVACGMEVINDAPSRYYEEVFEATNSEDDQKMVWAHLDEPSKSVTTNDLDVASKEPGPMEKPSKEGEDFAGKNNEEETELWEPGKVFTADYVDELSDVLSMPSSKEGKISAVEDDLRVLWQCPWLEEDDEQAADMTAAALIAEPSKAPENSRFAALLLEEATVEALESLVASDEPPPGLLSEVQSALPPELSAELPSEPPSELSQLLSYLADLPPAELLSLLSADPPSSNEKVEPLFPRSLLKKAYHNKHRRLAACRQPQPARATQVPPAAPSPTATKTASEALAAQPALGPLTPSVEPKKARAPLPNEHDELLLALLHTSESLLRPDLTKDIRTLLVKREYLRPEAPKRLNNFEQ